MRNKERKSFKRELRKNKSKRNLEELLESYGEALVDALVTTLIYAFFPVSVGFLAIFLFCTMANVSLKYILCYMIPVEVSLVISYLRTMHRIFKTAHGCEEKRNMILERSKELGEEEKRNMILERSKELGEEEKELDKVKTVVNNTMQKAKSNNEMDSDEILNDMLLNDMLFEFEKTNNNDNKEASYGLDETKDKTLKKTRK